MNFNSKWITTEDFATLAPINVYHREFIDPVEVPDSPIKNYHIHIRKKFSLESFNQVILNVSGDDYYKLYINGRFVAQGPEASYIESFDYNRIDITPFLVKGENIIAVHLYYLGEINRVCVSGDNRQGLIADLFVDGKYLFGTDESWKYSVSKEFSGDTVGYVTAYLENIDFNLAERGWRELDYDDSHYLPSVINDNYDYRFADKPAELIDVYRVEPTEVRKIGEGAYFVDFGKEITGQFYMQVKGDKGQKVTIRSGEELDDDNPDLARWQMRCNCNYEDILTLSGAVDEVEFFDYKSFRYVNVFTDRDNLSPDTFEAFVRHHKFEPKYKLDTEVPYLKDIFAICENALRIGGQGALVDCPSREKGVYLGDFTVSGLSYLYLTEDKDYYKKILFDFAKTAMIHKGIMCCATCSFMQEIADFSLQYPLQILNYYKVTNDIETVKELYPVALGILEYFERYRRADGLLEDVNGKWNLVDWPENLRDGYDANITKGGKGLDCHNVINAFYIGAIDTLNELSRIIEKPEYLDTAPLKAAFIKAFYNEESGLFCDSEKHTHSALHSNALPLFYGIATEKMQDKLRAFIMEKGLSCGVQFSYFVLKGLARIGAYEDEFKLVTNESEHSWVNMVREGASCCFEAWGKEQKWNTSLCHPWASSPIIAIFEDLNGKFGINLTKIDQ